MRLFVDLPELQYENDKLNFYFLFLLFWAAIIQLLYRLFCRLRNSFFPTDYVSMASPFVYSLFSY